MGKWFKRKGLQGLGFRAWLMFRESQLLILPFNNKKKLGRAFDHNCEDN